MATQKHKSSDTIQSYTLRDIPTQLWRDAKIYCAMHDENLRSLVLVALAEKIGNDIEEYTDK